MKESRTKKVLVAMSGGVDSSVAALLLKRQGYEVVGAFMRCFNIDGCAETDAEDARRVAGRIGIPFYTFDFEEAYKKTVVEYMIKGYKSGITPNPDVMCNREIKFGLFFKRAMTLGFDYVATGHYVRLKRIGNRHALQAAKDNNKDQSYFLWTLQEDVLKHCLFPIGDYKKSHIRTLAKKANLSTADKKDSQGICFLGHISIKDFLEKYLPKKPGIVMDQEGSIIGEHEGAHFYTIGQRHGLDLGAKGSMLRIKNNHETQPHYIVSKNIKTNTVVVAEGPNNPALYEKTVILKGVQTALAQSAPIYARVRYRAPLAQATISEIKNKKCTITFDEPQKFIAPGQSVVFYDKTGTLLGGGIIK